MAYHVIKKINSKPYHYLAENRRIGKNKWKRFEVYLKEGKISKAGLKRLIKRKSPELEEKIDSYLRATDPFYPLLAKGQLETLEKIRAAYRKKKKNAGKIELQSYEEWFITQFTYDTNAIEGSTMSKIETGMLLFEGRVPKDKSLREVYEAENHRKAYDYLKKHKGDINKTFILKLHETFLSGIWNEYAGRIRDMPVYIRGADFIPPPPAKVERELDQLLKWSNKNKRKNNAAIISAYFHSAFERINLLLIVSGRTGRLLINFMLEKNGYPMISIHFEDRDNYIRCLKEAHKGGLKPLVDLIFNYIKESKLLAPQK